jgi:hypothetical protein
MLELNIYQNRPLSFEVKMVGLNPKQAQGFLRIIVDGVEYGFKADVTEKDITVDLPALKSIIPRSIKEGEEFKAKLEIYTNGRYLNPWNGSFVVRTPAFVEARPKIDKAKIISEKKVNVVIKEGVTQEDIIAYMVKKGTSSKKVQNLILEGAVQKAKSKDPQDVMNCVVDFYNKSNKL